MEFLYIIFFVLIENIFSYNTVEGLRAENIIGGEEAKQNQFKYVVAVRYKSRIVNVSDHNPCIGAIIHDFFISTVAHCFYNESGELLKNEFYITVATIDLLNPSQSSRNVKVDLLFLPDIYDPLTPNNYYNSGNIAVVRLVERLRIFSGNRLLKKLKIPGRLFRPENETFTVAGYGWNTIVYITDVINGTVSELRAGESDGKLRFASGDILSRDQCQEKIHDYIASGNMCVKIIQSPHQRKGICQGDSGAPLVRKDYLAGIAIHSFPECNENRRPGIYIDTSFYNYFINTILSNDLTDNIRVFQLKEKLSAEYEFVEI